MFHFVLPVLFFCFFFLQHCKTEPAVPELHCSYPEESVAFTHSAALHFLRAVRLLVEAEWITGWSCRGVMWSAEMIPLHRECPTWKYLSFLFFLKVWTWSTVVSPFHPPTPPAAVQMQSFTPAGGESEMWGRAEWNGEPALVFTMRKRARDRERKREKLRPSVFFPPPCHTVTRMAAALLIGEQEEREGAGSTDQGSAAISQCFDQWSGAVSGSSPLSPLCLPQFPHPTPPTRHQPPSHSSRTCRQRWPPLALHCQRMMQQRHRRWPPPCTEGGGVTGAK